MTRNYEDLFPDYIDGRLTQTEVQIFEAALENDSKLAEAFAKYQLVMKCEEVLCEKTWEPSSFFEAKVIAAITPDHVSSERSILQALGQALRSLANPNRMAIGLASAMAVVTLSVYISSHLGPTPHISVESRGASHLATSERAVPAVLTPAASPLKEDGAAAPDLTHPHNPTPEGEGAILLERAKRPTVDNRQPVAPAKPQLAMPPEEMQIADEENFDNAKDQARNEESGAMLLGESHESHATAKAPGAPPASVRSTAKGAAVGKSYESEAAFGGTAPTLEKRKAIQRINDCTGEVRIFTVRPDAGARLIPSKEAPEMRLNNSQFKVYLCSVAGDWYRVAAIDPMNCPWRNQLTASPPGHCGAVWLAREDVETIEEGLK